MAAALELSTLKPVFEKHNVRFVGIGLGYIGLETFMEQKVWEGIELYVDDGKNLYKALGLGQGGLTQLMGASARADHAKAKQLNIKGDLKGDGMQLGGSYVVDKGGKVLLEFQQQKFGDHPTRESLLEALGIDLSELPPPPEPLEEKKEKA